MAPNELGLLRFASSPETKGGAPRRRTSRNKKLVVAKPPPQTKAAELSDFAWFALNRPCQMNHQRLLGVHAVFCLVEDGGVLRARGVVVDLIPIVGGQAV
jgi:hypothetical protein